MTSGAIDVSRTSPSGGRLDKRRIRMMQQRKQQFVSQAKNSPKTLSTPTSTDDDILKYKQRKPHLVLTKSSPKAAVSATKPNHDLASTPKREQQRKNYKESPGSAVTGSKECIGTHGISKVGSFTSVASASSLSCDTSVGSNNANITPTIVSDRRKRFVQKRLHSMQVIQDPKVGQQETKKKSLGQYSSPALRKRYYEKKQSEKALAEIKKKQKEQKEKTVEKLSQDQGKLLTPFQLEKLRSARKKAASHRRKSDLPQISTSQGKQVGEITKSSYDKNKLKNSIQKDTITPAKSSTAFLLHSPRTFFPKKKPAERRDDTGYNPIAATLRSLVDDVSSVAGSSQHTLETKESRDFLEENRDQDIEHDVTENEQQKPKDEIIHLIIEEKIILQTDQTGGMHDAKVRNAELSGDQHCIHMAVDSVRSPATRNDEKPISLVEDQEDGIHRNHDAEHDVSENAQQNPKDKIIQLFNDEKRISLQEDKEGDMHDDKATNTEVVGEQHGKHAMIELVRPPTNRKQNGERMAEQSPKFLIGSKKCDKKSDHPVRGQNADSREDWAHIKIEKRNGSKIKETIGSLIKLSSTTCIALQQHGSPQSGALQPPKEKAPRSLVEGKPSLSRAESSPKAPTPTSTLHPQRSPRTPRGSDFGCNDFYSGSHPRKSLLNETPNKSPLNYTTLQLHQSPRTQTPKEKIGTTLSPSKTILAKSPKNKSPDHQTERRTPQHSSSTIQRLTSSPKHRQQKYPYNSTPQELIELRNPAKSINHLQTTFQEQVSPQLNISRAPGIVSNTTQTLQPSITSSPKDRQQMNMSQSPGITLNTTPISPTSITSSPKQRQQRPPCNSTPQDRGQTSPQMNMSRSPGITLNATPTSPTSITSPKNQQQRSPCNSTPKELTESGTHAKNTNHLTTTFQGQTSPQLNMSRAPGITLNTTPSSPSVISMFQQHSAPESNALQEAGERALGPIVCTSPKTPTPQESKKMTPRSASTTQRVETNPTLTSPNVISMFQQLNSTRSNAPEGAGETGLGNTVYKSPKTPIPQESKKRTTRSASTTQRVGMILQRQRPKALEINVCTSPILSTAQVYEKKAPNSADTTPRAGSNRRQQRTPKGSDFLSVNDQKKLGKGDKIRESIGSQPSVSANSLKGSHMLHTHTPVASPQSRTNKPAIEEKGKKVVCSPISLDAGFWKERGGTNTTHGTRDTTVIPTTTKKGDEKLQDNFYQEGPSPSKIKGIIMARSPKSLKMAYHPKRQRSLKNTGCTSQVKQRRPRDPQGAERRFTTSPANQPKADPYEGDSKKNASQKAEPNTLTDPKGVKHIHTYPPSLQPKLLPYKDNPEKSANDNDKDAVIKSLRVCEDVTRNKSLSTTSVIEDKADYNKGNTAEGGEEENNENKEGHQTSNDGDRRQFVDSFEHAAENAMPSGDALSPGSNHSRDSRKFVAEQLDKVNHNLAEASSDVKTGESSTPTPRRVTGKSKAVVLQNSVTHNCSKFASVKSQSQEREITTSNPRSIINKLKKKSSPSVSKNKSISGPQEGKNKTPSSTYGDAAAADTQSKKKALSARSSAAMQNSKRGNHVSFKADATGQSALALGMLEHNKSSHTTSKDSTLKENDEADATPSSSPLIDSKSTNTTSVKKDAISKSEESTNTRIIVTTPMSPDLSFSTNQVSPTMVESPRSPGTDMSIPLLALKLPSHNEMPSTPESKKVNPQLSSSSSKNKMTNSAKRVMSAFGRGVSRSNDRISTPKERHELSLSRRVAKAREESASGKSMTKVMSVLSNKFPASHSNPENEQNICSTPSPVGMQSTASTTVGNDYFKYLRVNFRGGSSSKNPDNTDYTHIMD